jgi:Arm DNA-binding domain
MKFTQARINAFRPPVGKPEYELIDDAMPGFGVRWRANVAGKFGAGVYFAKAKVGAKHSRLGLGKICKVTLEHAQAEARDYFALAARKVNPSTERAKAVAKVNDTVESHIDGFVAYLRDDQQRGASHIKDVERTLHRYLKALHGFTPVDIDRAMVTKQLERIKVENGASMSRHCRSHAATFFAWLMATGVPLLVNPVVGTPTTKYKPREKMPTWDEMCSIWAALPDASMY